MTFFPSDAILDEKARVAALEAIDRVGHSLPTLLDAERSSLDGIASTLIGLLTSENEEICIASAKSLAEIVADSKQFAGGEIFPGLERVVSALATSVCSDQREKVRVAVVAALGRIAPAASGEIVRVLVRSPLIDPMSSVVREALRALTTCSPVTKQLAIRPLAAILDRDEPQLWQPALVAIESLGSDAISILPRLLNFFENLGREDIADAEESPPLRDGQQRPFSSRESSLVTVESARAVRQAAARAIASIDLAGGKVIEVAKSVPQLNSLVDSLEEILPDGAALLHNLRSQLAAISAVPIAGRRRMRSGDIARHIFGNDPDDSSEKNRQAKRIASWLTSGQLRGLRVRHGIVDVDCSDLESLKQLYEEGRLPQ